MSIRFRHRGIGSLINKIKTMLNVRSIKTQLIIYLACFAVFLSIKDGSPVFLLTTTIAVVSAFGIDSIIRQLRTKIFQIAESAIITGFIIGYVISSDEPWFVFVLASLLAILSKHVIRFKNKHLFNPAAFGIFLSTVLLGASTQWMGTYIWYIVVPFGLYWAHKTRRMEIIIGYAIVFFLLFGANAMAQRTPLLSVPGYISYFYVFVMVIEPRTGPAKPVGKYLFGGGAALLVFVLTQAGMRVDVELLSLLAMNAAVPLLNRLPFKKEV
ncbi:MAG: RnfABCDGE type electron transport complex subunit D [Candidatus Omnitrophota bacterium]